MVHRAFTTLPRKASRCEASATVLCAWTTNSPFPNYPNSLPSTYPTLFGRNSHQSVEFRRGVRWGQWPVGLCQNASLLAALWARKLAGFDGDLVGEQSTCHGTIDIELCSI